MARGGGLISLCTVLTVFLLVLAAAGSTTAHRKQLHSPRPKASKISRKATALFAFGDSYADTGNRDKNATSWNTPYGLTWPGHPSGRFGNGHIQTDFLAQVMGLPTPTPFVLSATQSIQNGVNFALGGSGVTFAYGVTPLGTQVDSFEVLLRSGVYSPALLASSVTLVSNVGNDYSATFNYTATELVTVIEQVVEGVVLSLKRLYELGLRNFLVANLPPVPCLPSVTIANNYTSCILSLEPSVVFHNDLLGQAMGELNQLPDANFAILDDNTAFFKILNDSAQFGITEKFAPCCKPLGLENYCGQVDDKGNPLYTVCDNPETHMWWDGVHPTEGTWSDIVGLFKNKPGFVKGAPTLELWLYENSLRPVLPPAPAPSGPVVPQGAVWQLETACAELVSQANYTEAMGLLQSINLEQYLTPHPEQTVTVFLPNNAAFYSLPISTFSDIYGEDRVIPVVCFHAVKGYYDISQLVNGTKTLTTFSNQQLNVTSTGTTVLVGSQAAKIIDPDLYKGADGVVVHGIDQLLFATSPS